jgi:hypothetical protein
MRILTNPICRAELAGMAENSFGNMVKAVVDVAKEILAVDGELHADEESLLLQEGSLQKDLWGINLYPAMTGEDFIEYDSMINIRPSQNNRSRGVDAAEIREKIARIVGRLVQP